MNKLSDLAQRQQEFLDKVLEWIEENDADHSEYPQWMVQEFVNHWCTIGDHSRKMEFEKQKTWSTGGRLRTWKDNSMSWHPGKWKTQSGSHYAPRQNKDGQMAGF